MTFFSSICWPNIRTLRQRSAHMKQQADTFSLYRHKVSVIGLFLVWVYVIALFPASAISHLTPDIFYTYFRFILLLATIVSVIRLLWPYNHVEYFLVPAVMLVEHIVLLQVTGDGNSIIISPYFLFYLATIIVGAYANLWVLLSFIVTALLYYYLNVPLTPLSASSNATRIGWDMYWLVVAGMIAGWFVVQIRQFLIRQEYDLQRLKRLYEERSLQAQHMKQVKEKADKASQAKSHFLAKVSHELRTPLNVIIGFSDVLSYHHTNKKLHHAAMSINSHGKTLLKLLNDILMYSTLSTQQDVIIEPFNITKLLRSAVKRHYVKALERGILLEEFIIEEMLVVTQPQKYMKQVIDYMLDEILALAEPGSSVYLYCQLIEQQYMVVQVDTIGQGINQEEIDALFSTVPVATPTYWFSPMQLNQTHEISTAIRKLVEMLQGRYSSKMIASKGNITVLAFPLTRSE